MTTSAPVIRSVSGHLIGGRIERPGDGEKTIAHLPPHDLQGEPFLVAIATGEQIHRAVAGAITAQSEWTALSVVARADAISAAAARLREHTAELAALLTSEVGKTVAESTGEILNAARLLDFHSGSALRPLGAVVASARPSTTADIRWEPLGVVAAITPWNFPVNITTVKLAAALAAGNAVVVKPSPAAAATTTRYLELISECFPSGLIAVVNGDGTVGQDLITATGINAVTFTGSTKVGREVAATAARHGIPAQAEMGGKNVIVLLESADLDLAVPAVAQSAYRMAGQKCTAVGTLLVHDTVYDEVLRRLSAELSSGALNPGDPRQEATIVGPLISPASRDQVLAQVAAAVAEGARLVHPPEGLPAVADTRSATVPPVLLADVTPGMGVATDEVFGPVLAVIRVAGVQEAVTAANASGYGLVSAVYTADLAEAMAYSQEVKAGTVLINQPTTGLDYHISFGGWGKSGHGPTEQSDEALRAFMRPKTRYISWNPAR